MTKSKKGKLRHIHIEPGGNGYSVRAHHMRDMKDAGNPTMDNDADDQPDFFNSAKDAANHVHGLLSAHEGSDAHAEPDADDEHPLRKMVRRR